MPVQGPRTRERAAARSLIQYLRGPEALLVLRSKGLDAPVSATGMGSSPRAGELQEAELPAARPLVLPVSSITCGSTIGPVNMAWPRYR